MRGRPWTGFVLLVVVVVVALFFRSRRPHEPSPPQTPAPVVQESPVSVPDLGGREIKIGSDTTYPPFEVVDADKTIIGFDPDMMREICKRANCKPTFITTAWEGIFVTLSQGQFDAVASGVTINDERRKTVEFSEPYLRYGQVVLVREDESAIDGVDGLRGRTVGVQTGTTNDDKATALQREGKIGTVRRYENFALAVKALLNKDIDAVVIDSFAADGFMQVNQGQLKRAGPTFTSEAVGIALRQGDTTLKPAFDAALARMKTDGTLEALYKKWFVEQPPRP